MTTTRPGSRTPARPTGTWSGSSTSCGTATPSAPCSILEDLRDDFEIACASDDADDKQRAFFERLSEFCTYIDRNSEQIPNYGERHRCGEPISTATAEATVNQVISRRMVKKQQMRWSPRGAHLLLQVRTRVLNNDLAGDFARWYPGLTIPDRPLAAAA